MRKPLPRFVLLAIAACLLSACGDDDGDAADVQAPPSSPPNPPPTATNNPPTISGTPPTVTLQGRVYSFRPAAADADGDALTFSVSNLPPWASFETSSGRVRGTPQPAQVGSFNDIRISVSDGRATESLAPFNIAVVATATGSATLSWLPPTQNTDGSPLTDLAGYRIRFGTQGGDYENLVTVGSSGLASYVIDQLTPATWEFVVTAVNSNDVESPFSNRASTTIR